MDHTFMFDSLLKADEKISFLENCYEQWKADTSQQCGKQDFMKQVK